MGTVTHRVAFDGPQAWHRSDCRVIVAAQSCRLGGSSGRFRPNKDDSWRITRIRILGPYQIRDNLKGQHPTMLLGLHRMVRQGPRHNQVVCPPISLRPPVRRHHGAGRVGRPLWCHLYPRDSQISLGWDSPASCRTLQPCPGRNRGLGSRGTPLRLRDSPLVSRGIQVRGRSVRRFLPLIRFLP